MVILYELRGILRKGIDDTACHCHWVGKTLFGEGFTGSMAVDLVVVGLVIAIATDTGHVVHRAGHGGFDAGVGGGSV